MSCDFITIIETAAHMSVRCFALALLLTLRVALSRGETFTTYRPVLKVAGRGGQNGTPFDDLKANKTASILNIHSITIVSGKQVDSIQVTYRLTDGSLYKALQHGTGTNHPVTIKLDSNEYVWKVEGKTNDVLVDQLTITTRRLSKSEERTYGPYGRTGKFNFTFEGYIAGFHGRAGNLLDNIGVYKLAPAMESDIYGLQHYFGGDFDENPDTDYPPVVKVHKLIVYYWTDSVHSLQVEYNLLGGGTRLGALHGDNSKGNSTTIQLGDDETVITINGKLDYQKIFLNELSFGTKRRNGSVTVYGPFGNGSVPFAIQGNIIGFTGTASNFLQAIGAYTFDENP